MPRNACTSPMATPLTGPLSVATKGDVGAADARVGALATTLARTATTRMHPIPFDLIVGPPQRCTRAVRWTISFGERNRSPFEGRNVPGPLSIRAWSAHDGNQGFTRV